MTYPIPRKTKIGAVLMLVAVFFASIGASIAYINDTRQKMNRERIAAEEAIREERIRSEQEWCGIYQLFVETYRVTPPTNEIGRVLQREFERLYTVHECATLPRRPTAPPALPASPMPSPSVSR